MAETPQQNEKSSSSRGRYSSRILLGVALGIVLPGAILAAGAFGAMTLMKTAPQAERERGGERPEQARLVEVEFLSRGEHPVTVEAMGTVRPARAVSVQPQVSGRIVSMSDEFAPGGYFQEGEELLAIDPSDYELAIREAEAAIAQAEGDLRIEMGQQQLARQEFELLGEEIPEGEAGLVLREPQLAKAQANLDAARVALQSAQLDLERTKVTAPFDSLVISENVEPGKVVSPSTVLAELVGTDQFWVELAVPVDDLRFISLPGPGGEGGSQVVLRDDAAWGPGRSRVGRVIRFTGSLSEESRMATLLVGVDDPLALEEENDGEPRLLLNSYVRAEIQGRPLPDVALVPREYLHGGNTVWIMDEQGKLDIREVEIAWRGPEKVLVSSGVEDGDALVITNLPTPVEGMGLRTTSAVDSIESARPEMLPVVEEEPTGDAGAEPNLTEPAEEPAADETGETRQTPPGEQPS